MVGDHILYFVVEQEELVDGDASPVAALVAFYAAFAFPGLHVFGCQSGTVGDLGAHASGDHVVFDLAVFADAPDQPLGDGGDQGGGHQVWFHPHVDEAVDRSHRVIGMQSGEHQVSGEC